MNLIANLLLRLSSPYFHITSPTTGSLYMERYWLLGARNPNRNCGNPYFDKAQAGGRLYQWLTDRLAIRIHIIHRSDDDALHDHPFGFVSLVLQGGYWEVMAGHSRLWRGPWSLAYRPAKTWHRIIIPASSKAITVCVLGPKVQSWGFLYGGKKVFWKEYLKKYDGTGTDRNKGADFGANQTNRGEKK